MGACMRVDQQLSQIIHWLLLGKRHFGARFDTRKSFYATRPSPRLAQAQAHAVRNRGQLAHDVDAILHRAGESLTDNIVCCSFLRGGARAREHYLSCSFVTLSQGANCPTQFRLSSVSSSPLLTLDT